MSQQEFPIPGLASAFQGQLCRLAATVLLGKSACVLPHLHFSSLKLHLREMRIGELAAAHTKKFPVGVLTHMHRHSLPTPTIDRPGGRLACQVPFAVSPEAFSQD